MSYSNPRIAHPGTLALVAFCLLAVTALSPALAQDEGKPADGETPVRVHIGRSHVVKAPWPVTRVSVAEPKIADVQVAAPNQVVVLAQTPGTTDLVLWNEDGEAFRTAVKVELDTRTLEADLTKLFPTADLIVGESQGIVTVRGTLRRIEDTKRLKGFMETAGIKYVDMTGVAGVQQVQIHVRVAEANRIAMRSLGVNAFVGGSDFFGGSTVGGNSNLINVGPAAGAPITQSIPFTFNGSPALSSAATLFMGIPPADLGVFIEALEDNRYMRILAEPTLVALSGEEASFLAGGEFPIPVAQDSGAGAGGAGTAITIEFKEFGVRLRFRPTVLGDGTIRLHVSPEVSELSDIGAVEIQGLTIPALNTRRADTTLEMRSGQTFALAGLISSETRARSEKVPGLGSMPVLGTLFRSVRYQQEDTELVVIATVSLVEPLSVTRKRPVPGDLHDAPNAWELYMNGNIEGTEPMKVGPANQNWLRENGLDRLRGPGAWKSYIESPAAPPTAPAPK